jgi:hypothetical protein
MTNNYKYITTIYFKRAFFITNSKACLRRCNPDAPFSMPGILQPLKYVHGFPLSKLHSVR